MHVFAGSKERYSDFFIKLFADLKLCIDCTKLKIRWSIEDNSEIIFLFLIENICCDPLLEPSQ